MHDGDESSERAAPKSDVASASPSPPPSSPASSSSVYDHRFALYYSYFFAAFGDRMWEFASVVYIMTLFPSTLLYSSLFGLLELLGGVIAGPYIGRAIDSLTISRLSIVRLSIIGQNVSISAAAALLFLLLHALPTLSPTFLYLGYGLLTAAAMVAKAASSLNKVSVHKDWLVVLGEGRSERLSSLNGAMRGIDLCCSVVGPLMVGVGEVVIGQELTVVLVGLWAAISLLIELALVGRVWKEIPQLQHKQSQSSAAEQLRRAQSGGGVERRGDEGLGAALLPAEDAVDGGRGADASLPSPRLARSYWSSLSLYVAHPVFLPSFAYCLLYLSLLSFGGIMTSYLVSDAVALSPALLAVGRAVAAIVGLLSTLTIPSIIPWLGLPLTGGFALLAQSLCLSIAVLALYIGVHTTLGLTLLFIGLCTSRYGLWSFDLVETQIMQEGVREGEVGAMNGVQESGTNVLMAASFVLTMVWQRPEDILWPVWISFGGVLLASVLHTYWVIGKAGTEWERGNKPTLLDAPDTPIAAAPG